MGWLQDHKSDIAGWLVLAGIVLVVLFCRRKYSGKYASDVAAAEARGEANAVAKLTAQQNVHVAVDASSGRAQSEGGHAFLSCGEPWGCAQCSPGLARLLGDNRGRVALDPGEQRGGVATGVHYDYYDHYDNSADDYSSARRVDNGRHGGASSVNGVNVGGGARDWCGRCFPAPCDCVDPISRAELVADMARRPWAYNEHDRLVVRVRGDEADPRFERRLSGGRGPGR
jgi:hypothetical protein